MPRKKPILDTNVNSNDSANNAVSSPAPAPQLPVADDEDDTDTQLQASKTEIGNMHTSDLNDSVEPPKKTRKPQTEAQKKATAIMRQKLAEKWERSRAEKAAAEAEHKRLMEEKILKKAISIKKKQIKAQKPLDVISDDDTPMEEIIPLVKKTRQASTANQTAPPKPPAPRIVFL